MKELETGKVVRRLRGGKHVRVQCRDHMGGYLSPAVKTHLSGEQGNNFHVASVAVEIPRQ